MTSNYYDLRSFVKNAREYGISEAIKKDFQATRERTSDGLLKLVFGSVIAGCAIVAAPKIIFDIGMAGIRYKPLKSER